MPVNRAVHNAHLLICVLQPSLSSYVAAQSKRYSLAVDTTLRWGKHLRNVLHKLPRNLL